MDKITKDQSSNKISGKSSFITPPPDIGFAAGLRVSNLRLMPASPQFYSESRPHSADSTILEQAVTPLPSLSSSIEGDETEENNDFEKLDDFNSPKLSPLSQSSQLKQSPSSKHYVFDKLKSSNELRAELQKKQMTLKSSINLFKSDNTTHTKGNGDDHLNLSHRNSSSIKASVINQEGCGDENNPTSPVNLKKSKFSERNKKTKLFETLIPYPITNNRDDSLKTSSFKKFRKWKSFSNLSKSGGENLLRNYMKRPLTEYFQKNQEEYDYEIEDIKIQRDSLELEIFEMNEKYTSLLNEHEQLQEKVNKLKINKMKENSVEDELKKKIYVIQNINKTLENRLNLTNSKLNDSLARIKNLEEEIKTNNEKYVSLRKQCTSLKSMKTNLDGTNNHFKKRIHDLEESYERSEDDKKQLKSDLKVALDQRVSEKSKLETQLEEARGITKRVKMALDKAQNEILEKREKEKLANKEKEGFEAKIRELEDKISQFESSPKMDPNLLDKTQQELEEEKNCNHELRKQLNDNDKMMIHIDQIMKEFIGVPIEDNYDHISGTEVLTQLTKTLEQVGETIKYLNDYSKDLDMKLKTSNNKFENEIESLKNHIVSLNEEKNDLEKTLEYSRSELRKRYLAELDISETVDHLKTLRLDYEKLANKYEISQKKIQSLTKQLDAAEERMCMQIEAKQNAHDLQWGEALIEKERLMQKLNLAEKQIVKQTEEIIKGKTLKEKLEEQVLDLEKCSNKYQASEVESQKTLSLLRISVNKLDKEKCILENELDKIRFDEDQLREEKNNLLKQLSEMQQNFSQLIKNQEIETLELQNQMKDVQNEFETDFNQLKNRYEKIIIDYEDEKNTNASTLKNCEERIYELERMKNYQIGELENTITEYKETQEKLFQEFTLEKENRKKIELDGLEKLSIIQDLQADNYLLNEEKNTLHEKLKEIIENKTHLEEQILQLKNRHIEFDNQWNNLNEQHKSEQNTNIQLLHEIEGLRNETIQLKGQLELAKSQPIQVSEKNLFDLQTRLKQAERETFLSEVRLRALSDELLQTRETSELTIKSLRHQVDVLSKQKRKSKDKLSANQDNMKYIKAIADSHFVKSTANLNALRTEDHKRIKQLEKELMEANSEIKKLLHIINAEPNERNRACMIKDRGDNHETSNGSQIAELQKLLRDRENRISQLIQDKENFLRTIQYAKDLESAGDISALREKLTAEVVSRDEQISHLRHQCSQFENYNIECQDNIRVLERQLIDLQNYTKSLKEKSAESDEVKELIDLNHKCAEIQKQLSQALRERDDLEQFISRKYREIEIRDRELNCLREKLNWAEKKLLSLNNELDINRSYITKLKVEKIASTHHCREIYKRMDEKNDELRKLRKVVKRLQKK